MQRNDQNDYMSRKRYLLNAWRQFVRQEKRACRSIRGALSKILWKRGFDRIRNCSRTDARDTAEYKQASRVLRRFLNVRLRDAFGIWRNSIKRKVQQKTLFVEEEFASAQGTHSENKQVQFEHIEKRGVQSIRGNKTRRTLQHWFRMMKVLKNLRMLQLMFRYKQNNIWKKHALRRWSDRRKETVRMRGMVERLRLCWAFRTRRRLFLGWQRSFDRLKLLLIKLRNLAVSGDHSGLDVGFRAIKHFADSKRVANVKQKRCTGRTIQNLLGDLVRRRLRHAFDQINCASSVDKREQEVRHRGLRRCIGRILRHYFQRWRMKNEERRTYQWLDEEGPERDRFIHHQNEARLLRNFLEREEGYTPDELQKIEKVEEAKQHEKMMRAVRRLQLAGTDGSVLPVALQRWRQWTKLRKLFRYWLNFTNEKY